jgi:hypothetical protein
MGLSTLGRTRICSLLVRNPDRSPAHEPPVFHRWWNTAKRTECAPFALRLNGSSIAHAEN